MASKYRKTQIEKFGGHLKSIVEFTLDEISKFLGGWWEWTGWPQNIKSPEWQNWAKETQFDFTPYLKPKKS